MAIFDYTTILTQQKRTNLGAIEVVKIEKVALYKGRKQDDREFGRQNSELARGLHVVSKKSLSLVGGQSIVLFKIYTSLGGVVIVRIYTDIEWHEI